MGAGRLLGQASHCSGHTTHSRPSNQNSTPKSLFLLGECVLSFQGKVSSRFHSCWDEMLSVCALVSEGQCRGGSGRLMLP